MTNEPTFVPEPVDPEDQAAEETATAWDPDDWPEMAATTGVAATNREAATTSEAETNREATTTVLDTLDFSGATSQDNHLGTYAMFFGVVSAVATAALFLWGAGIEWLDLLLGGAGAIYGVRGFNACARGRATNRWAAVIGGVLGLIAAGGSAVYLVLSALALTSTLP